MLLIKNGKILTMAGTNYESGSILIDKGKIVKVGESVDINSHEISQVIDASYLWVMPGIIEAHCHAGIEEERKGFEGNDGNEITTPITPYLRGMDGINAMDSAFANAISVGITSMMVGPGSSNVVGGQWVFIKTHGRAVDSMIVLQPSAMKIAFGENPKSNYEEKNMMPSTRMSIAAMLREELFDAQEYYQKKKDAQQSGDDFIPEFKKECWIPVF